MRRRVAVLSCVAIAVAGCGSDAATGERRSVAVDRTKPCAAVPVAALDRAFGEQFAASGATAKLESGTRQCTRAGRRVTVELAVVKTDATTYDPDIAEGRHAPVVFTRTKPRLATDSAFLTQPDRPDDPQATLIVLDGENEWQFDAEGAAGAAPDVLRRQLFGLARTIFGRGRATRPGA